MLRDPTDPWMDERALATPDPEPKTDPTPEHRRRETIDACTLCDPDGMHNGFPCHHQDTAATAARGMAEIRAKMGWPATGTPDTPS